MISVYIEIYGFILYLSTVDLEQKYCVFFYIIYIINTNKRNYIKSDLNCFWHLIFFNFQAFYNIYLN